MASSNGFEFSSSAAAATSADDGSSGGADIWDMDEQRRFCFRREMPEAPHEFSARKVRYATQRPYAAIELPANFFPDRRLLEGR